MRIIRLKTIVAILVVLAATSVSVLAQVSFLQDDAQVWLHVYGLGDLSHGWGPPPQVSPSGLEAYYESQYGRYPDMVFWTNIGVSSYTIDFYMSVLPQPPKRVVFDTWNSQLSWSSIEDNFLILMQDAVTGVKDTLTTSEAGGTGTLSLKNDFRNGYETHYKVDAYSLIPTEDHLFKVWAELWEDKSDPLTKVGVTDTAYVVTSKVDTAQDSLQYSYSFDYDTNISYMHSIYNSFPDNSHINKLLFEYYYMNADCDSVTAIGARLTDIYSNEENLVVFSDAMGYEEMIESKIHDICVDGYPQPEKYAGTLFYYDDGE